MKVRICYLLFDYNYIKFCVFLNISKVLKSIVNNGNDAIYTVLHSANYALNIRLVTSRLKLPETF